jgi:hypothetical protein
MRVTARHEPGQEMKLRMVPDRTGDREVIPLANHDPPAHEIRDLGEFLEHRRYRVDAELGKCLLDVKGGGA